MVDFVLGRIRPFEKALGRYFGPTFAQRFGTSTENRSRNWEGIQRAGGWLRSSAALCWRLLHPLPQTVSLDQHILGISILLFPLLAQPAKVSPVALLTLLQPLDQFEVDLGTRLLNHHRKGFPRLAPQDELFQFLQLMQNLFKAVVEDLVLSADSVEGLAHASYLAKRLISDHRQLLLTAVAIFLWDPKVLIRRRSSPSCSFAIFRHVPGIILLTNGAYVRVRTAEPKQEKLSRLTVP